jgi:hypothetical protein
MNITGTFVITRMLRELKQQFRSYECLVSQCISLLRSKKRNILFEVSLIRKIHLLRWCRNCSSLKRLHNPVKHCGLSSRRSRVQIPAGAITTQIEFTIAGFVPTMKKLTNIF